MFPSQKSRSAVQRIDMCISDVSWFSWLHLKFVFSSSTPTMSVKTNVVPVTSYLEPWLPCSDWLVKLLRDCAWWCRCCQALCKGADARLRTVRGAAEVRDTRPGSREVMVNQLERWSEVMASLRGLRASGGMSSHRSSDGSESSSDFSLQQYQ